MKSFKNVIIRQIKRRSFSREYFEETIANWLMHGWLTEDEAVEVFQVLDQYCPVSGDVTEDVTE